jgi:hypothetical protein
MKQNILNTIIEHIVLTVESEALPSSLNLSLPPFLSPPSVPSSAWFPSLPFFPACTEVSTQGLALSRQHSPELHSQPQSALFISEEPAFNFYVSIVFFFNFIDLSPSLTLFLVVLGFGPGVLCLLEDMLPPEPLLQPKPYFLFYRFTPEHCLSLSHQFCYAVFHFLSIQNIF